MSDEAITEKTEKQGGFLVRSGWRDGRFVRIRIPKTEKFGDPGWWLGPLAPQPAGGLQAASIQIAGIPTGNRARKWPILADRITVYPSVAPSFYTRFLNQLPRHGEYLYPKIARDRARNLKFIEHEQRIEREREEARRAERLRLRGESYFWPEEKNDLLDQYQDMIGRIVSKSLNRGLTSWTEKTDLKQRLNLALISILDRYKPVRGARLDTYVYGCLLHELSKAINEENETDGITGKPEGFRAFQSFGRETEPDVGWEGKRSFTPDSGTCEDEPRFSGGENDSHDGGADLRPRAACPMVSWANLRYRELRRIMKWDVQATVDILDSQEEHMLNMWERDFSQEEIGVHLRMSQPTVSRRLLALLEKLKTALAEYEYFDVRPSQRTRTGETLFAMESEGYGESPKVGE